MVEERFARCTLAVAALLGLIFGGSAFLAGYPATAGWMWTAATIPVVIALAVSIVCDLTAGRMGVDAIALLAMSAALLLQQPLAAIVVAIMYTGGTVLEDYAVSRAERNLKTLVDRAPRLAHRRIDETITDVDIRDVKVGDAILVRAGEIVPVDGLITSPRAVLDEAALTGEPIPVTRQAGESARSGTLNAGDTFQITATATADESTYAGIVRLVTAAQTAKSPSFGWRIATRCCCCR